MAKLGHYIVVDGKRLRMGYTTGTCAAAAAAAATRALVGGGFPSLVRVDTPAGIPVDVDVEDAHQGSGWASCAVRKDAGDDPDVTDGLAVYARVERQAAADESVDDASAPADDAASADASAPEGAPAPTVDVEGGAGVGRVTLPGLDQPVGAAAINSVPRQMIRQAVALEAQAAGVCGRFLATISVPEGAAVAQKTFNPRLGIQGGISILGTTGIVKPMSTQALVASIHAEIDVALATGRKDLLITPGNYGRHFAADALGLDAESSIQCSNFIGETVDYAALQGAESMLIVGNIGKMVKVAAGVMNTHSRMADARLETLAAYAGACGAGAKTVRDVLACATTDAALDVLDAAGCLVDVMSLVMERISYHLERRAAGKLNVQAVVFSNVRGLLGQTAGAQALAALHAAGGKDER